MLSIDETDRLKALITGVRPPETGFEKHFMRVLRGEAMPCSLQEREWYEFWRYTQSELLVAQKKDSDVSSSLVQPGAAITTAPKVDLQPKSKVRPKPTKNTSVDRRRLAQHLSNVLEVVQQVSWLRPQEVRLLKSFEKQLTDQPPRCLTAAQLLVIDKIRGRLFYRDIPRVVSGGAPGGGRRR